MASYRDRIQYFRGYGSILALSIAASSLFEVMDLLVPYRIGQILNVLSKQPLEALLVDMIGAISAILH